MQSDGKIVVAGFSNSAAAGTNYDFAVIRFNTDGSLDTSFSGDGIAVTPVAVAFLIDAGYAVAIQSDGRIVVAGEARTPGSESIPSVAIVRYNTDGSLDTSFDGDGKVITSINTYARTVAIQSDGRIVIAGRGPNGFTLVRYNTNGLLDISFDGDGVVRTSFGSGFGSDGAFSVAVQSDGRIVAVGNRSGGGDIVFAVVRYNLDGSLDTSFDSDGIVFTSIGNEDDATSVAIQPDNKIVVSGLSFIQLGVPEGVAVVRYKTNGTLDDTFDGDGMVLTPQVGYLNSFVAPVAIQSDGRIVAATSISNGADYDFGAVRYNSDGSLDNSFDKDGIVRTPLVNDEWLYAVGIQSDGRIVTVGMTGPNYDFGVVRYNGAACVAAPSISGTVTYGNAIGSPNPRFVSNVLLSGVGSTNVSTLSDFPGGNYALTGFGAGSYTITPSKTDGVNSITSFDAAKIAQHVAAVSTLTGNQLIVADVSGNGTISSFDAGQIARYVAAVPGSGSTANWIFMPATRNYSSVTGNVTGEDFIGLLMGEVSGNWTNTAPTMSKPAR